MKKIIVITLLLSALRLGSQTNVMPISNMVPTNIVYVFDINTISNFSFGIHPIYATNATVLSTNAILNICMSGQVCAVKGHWWLNGRVGESESSSFLDYHPNTIYRHCHLCGRSESKDIGWR